jgi:hypothetical protein
MSIKPFIDATSIANEIRLQRQVDKVTFLIVEGHDDFLTFTPLVQKDKCYIIEANGKENVISVISILNRDNFKGVLAIADRDFDDILGVTHALDNFILTEEHDIEMMIINSPAFERLLLEKGSTTKIAAELERSGKSVKAICAEKAKAVGCLRLISIREGLALNFDDLQFRFVSRRSFDLDGKGLVNLVVGRTQNCKVNRAELLSRTVEEMGKGHHEDHICVGHDLVCILSIGLRYVFGSCAVAECTPDLLGSILRAGFSVADFHVTELFRDICLWEADHPDFRFIRGPCP